MKDSNFLFFTLVCLFLFGNQSLNAQSCNTGKLDTNVAQFLKTIPPDNRSVEEMTKTFNAGEYRKGGPPVISYPTKDVQHIKITSDSIPILIFKPAHYSGTLPIIIQYHGGGFILPLVSWMEYFYWHDANTFNAIVFAVDYRVAPEHKFPAAVNDCYNAFKWISEHGEQYGGDTSRIIIKGESAGANLVAVVCQKAKSENIARQIRLQVMNCPVVDNPVHAEQYRSMQQNANGYFLTKPGVLFALKTYADSTDFNNPEFAPILSKDLSHLPPAVMITAEFDPLRDQGIAYAERLRKAGVKVWYKCFSGQIHVLISSLNESPANKEADAMVLTAMKEVMNRKIIAGN